MASIFKTPPYVHRHRHRYCSLISLSSSPVVSSFNFCRTASLLQVRLRAQRAESEGGRIGSQESFGAELLRSRRPSIVERKDVGKSSGEEEEVKSRDFNEKVDEEEEEWVDWEDQILQDTVPLVGFVRMILHSDKYASGDRLTSAHEKIILDRLLPYHPEAEKKIGCGIDYLTVGYHPDFEGSRCLFIVRKDGELVDFSYWKCLKGLIRKNYPLYADSFILRHFRRRRQ